MIGEVSLMQWFGLFLLVVVSVKQALGKNWRYDAFVCIIVFLAAGQGLR